MHSECTVRAQECAGAHSGSRWEGACIYTYLWVTFKRVFDRKSGIDEGLMLGVTRWRSPYTCRLISVLGSITTPHLNFFGGACWEDRAIGLGYYTNLHSTTCVGLT